MTVSFSLSLLLPLDVIRGAIPFRDGEGLLLPFVWKGTRNG